MLTVPLLAATLALAPTGQKLSVETWATGNFGAGQIQFGPIRNGAPSAATLLGGGASAGATLAFDPIVDDDAPPSLQFYLQRASTFWLSGGGSGATITYDRGSAPLDRTGGDASLGMNGYFGRTKRFYGGASFSFNYSDDHFRGLPNSATTIVFPIDVTFGVRVGDVRVRAEWQVSPQKLNSGGVQVPYWYNLSLHAYGVVRRKIEWTVSATALEQGFSGDLEAVVWLARRLGVAVEGFGGHTRSSVASTTRDFAGGQIGLTAWFTARLALRTYYQPGWIHWYDGPTGNPDETRIDHAVFLGVVGRPF